MTAMTLARKLDDLHKHFIAAEIARHIVVAGDTGHAMRKISRFLIDSLLWCWTADGIDGDGDAKRDLLKYDCDLQRHTAAAVERWEENGRKGTGLRHEHAVPRRELIELLLRLRPTETEVFDLLEKMCFAVIVTKEEDDKLSEKYRNRMPTTLSRDTNGDALLARYIEVNLKTAIRSPRRAG